MMSMRSLLAGFALIALSFPAGAEAPLTEQAVTAVGERAMEELDLVGLSVAVVGADGSFVQHQFGVKARGQAAPVDAGTLFPIASMSKAFTTASLALLVERGVLAWDDPVRKYIPEFEMGDPYLNEHFSVRDLITHRSGMGLGAGDLLFNPDTDAGPADVLQVLRAIPPATSFRDRYAYDNLLYIVAGDLIRRIDGRSWADFVRQEIFGPLGMTECVALPPELAASANRVVEHAPYTGSEGMEAVHPEMVFRDGMGPAGGIACTVADLSKWAAMWLNHGAAAGGGRRLLTAESVDELWRVVTPVSSQVPFGEAKAAHLRGYALGWFVQDMLGRAVVNHSGGSYGATSFIALAPEEGVAVIALGNQLSSAPSAVSFELLGEVLRARPLPEPHYLADAAQDWRETQAQIASLSQTTAPPAAAAPPPAPLAAFAGRYVDPWFGEAVVSLKDGKLMLDLPRTHLLDGPLTAFDGARFLAAWPERRLLADAFVDFQVEGGKVTGFTMATVSDVTDFSYDFQDLHFRRVAAAE